MAPIQSSDAIGSPTAARLKRYATGRGVIVKDHYAETAFQRLRLAAMDWVGNRQFGVGRDGHYLSRSEWDHLWARQGQAVMRIDETLDLYPAPAKPLFENGLHFVARLEPSLTSA